MILRHRPTQRTVNGSSQNRGFSLIEVAIAVVIIGLITSFAIKGKELIHTAKLRTIGDQVDAFNLAAQSFLDKYGAMPGDLRNATEMIEGATENGRGDGTIRSIEDAKRFWQHLSASGVIGLELVNGFPVSKIGGYYSVSTNIPNCHGTWIVLSGGTQNNTDFSGLLSQEEAHFVDKNHDTGNPSSGDIRTIKSGGTALGQQYDVKNKNKDCIIMFRIL
jgi:prepilin-type N-terminal cleavage/methylation domain-containing protein